MESASAVGFSAAARSIAAKARRRGLAVPGFRSPPALAGAVRTIRWRPDGGAVVAVRLRGRARREVIADMVEGVLRCNGIDGPRADAEREALNAAGGAA